MKHWIALAILMTAGAVPANAQTYVSAHGGLTVPNDPQVQMKTNNLTVDLDDGFVGGVAAGYDFGPVRIEAEAGYAQASVARIYDAKRSFNYREGSQARRYAMLNAYLDVPVSRAVTLYGGGGAGITRMHMRAAGGDPCAEVLAVRTSHTETTRREGANGTCTAQGRGQSNGFTWQAMAGLDFAAGKGWSIGPQFRYVSVNGIETAAKSNPTRETRFRTRKEYTSLNALVTLRKSF